MTPDSPLKYRADIDGLRSIAVMLVLIFHFKLIEFGKAGFLGVDVFFVISGYLITNILFAQLDRDAGKLDFADFYLKRIRRLAPVFFIVLVAVLAIGYFTLLPQSFAGLAKQVIFSQLYVSNVYFWQSINYFGLHADSVPLLHTWSLAVEEQFYLLFPLLIFLLFKLSRRWFWHSFILCAVISFGINILFYESKPEATFYLMPTRAWELMLGGLLVPLLQMRKEPSRVVKEICGVLGLALIVLAVAFYTEEIGFPGYFALLPTLGAAAIIYAGGTPGSTINNILSSVVPVYIGRLSYSLYLIHWPVHIFASNYFGQDYTLKWRLLFFLLTFVFSALMLALIEDPVRKISTRAQVKTIVFGYFGGLVLSVVLCSSILLTHGLPSRFSESAQLMASYIDDRPPEMPECEAKSAEQYQSSDFCAIGTENVLPTWVVIGDSHAWALKNAFSIWLRERGEAGLFMFRHACPPLKDVDLFKSKGECMHFNNAAYDFVGKTEAIQNVVLVSTWAQARESVLTANWRKQPTETESLDIFSSGFANSVQYLYEKGKNVYVWGPVPGARSSVPESLAVATNIATRERELSIPLVDYRREFSFFFDALDRSGKKVAKFISPAKALCETTNICKVMINDRPVYFDNAHPAYSLSQYWADVIAQQVGE